MAKRRRVHQQDAARRAFGERRGRLVLVEVEAPVPGVTGMPPPRPKISTSSTFATWAWRTCADSQIAAASRSSLSVSLLPGTRTVGVVIGASAAIVSASPLWTEAKSPTPTTRSASALHSDELGGLAEVPVEVAEGENSHVRSLSTHEPTAIVSEILRV